MATVEHRASLDSGTIDADLVLALALADTADEISSQRFLAADLRVDTKPDQTPVTEADRAVEAALRDRLAETRPGDGIVGEEQGEQAGTTGRRWILDPIDATANYLRGVPVWATLIAAERDGVVEVGVVSAPALGRRWYAARGEGAYERGRRLHVSAIGDLADAHVGYDDVPSMELAGVGDRFLALARRCWRTRGFGDFWTHMLVAEGAMDVSYEPGVNYWDLAALVPIVEEAGGRCTDLDGASPTGPGPIVCTNRFLHDDALAALRG